MRYDGAVFVDGGLPLSPIPHVEGGSHQVHPFTVYPQPLRNHSYGTDPCGISPMLLKEEFTPSLPVLAGWALGFNLQPHDLTYMHAAGKAAATAWLQKQ